MYNPGFIGNKMEDSGKYTQKAVEKYSLLFVVGYIRWVVCKHLEVAQPFP
jgi:hypothetical protein